MSDAILSMRKLEAQVGDSFNGQSIIYDVAYNTSQTAAFDLLEQSVDQQAASAASEFFIWLHIPSLAPAWFNAALQNLFTTIYTIIGSDVTVHVGIYQSALHNGEKVLVVSHSQGNLYANEAREILKTALPALPLASFGIFGVATPATNVGGEAGPYLTNDRDIIQFVPGALPPNLQLTHADGRVGTDVNALEAHSFDTYVSAQYNTSSALIQGVKASLERLQDPIPDCPTIPKLPTLPPGALPQLLTSELAGILATNSKCYPNIISQISLSAFGGATGTGCFSSVDLPDGSTYIYHDYARNGYTDEIHTTLGIYRGLNTSADLIVFTPISGPAYVNGGDQKTNDVASIVIEAGSRAKEFVEFVSDRPCTLVYQDLTLSVDTFILPNSRVLFDGVKVTFVDPNSNIIASGSVDDLLGPDFEYVETHYDSFGGGLYGVGIYISTDRKDSTGNIFKMSAYAAAANDFSFSTNFRLNHGGSVGIRCTATP